MQRSDTLVLLWRSPNGLRKSGKTACATRVAQMFLKTAKFLLKTSLNALFSIGCMPHRASGQRWDSWNGNAKPFISNTEVLLTVPKCPKIKTLSRQTWDMGLFGLST